MNSHEDNGRVFANEVILENKVGSPLFSGLKVSSSSP
jgi:hypothetical protein